MYVESLQSHCIHTQFHWSSSPPICFPSQGTQVQSPGGYLCETGILLLALNWWPWHDWSLWPCLSRASSQTVIMLLCQQCDNPTWSHTAFLSQFHTRCRSSFWLHNHIVGCWGGGSPVESLQSHCSNIQFHWSSGPPICFPSWGAWVQSPGGYLLFNLLHIQWFMFSSYIQCKLSSHFIEWVPQI